MTGLDLPFSDAAGFVTEAGDEFPICGRAPASWSTPCQTGKDGSLLPEMLRTTMGGPAHGPVEECVLPARAVLRIPDTFLRTRGPSACCGSQRGARYILAYRSARESRALLQGTGGLATIALGFAKAAGARIAVSSAAGYSDCSNVASISLSIVVNMAGVCCWRAHNRSRTRCGRCATAVSSSRWESSRIACDRPISRKAFGADPTARRNARKPR
jgi:hypothetical protein